MPLPPGISDVSYLRAINEIAIPVLKEFKPEIVFVSAGYDGHYADPLGGMQLSPKCYFEISRALKALKVGVAFALEGGYSLDALAESVHATIAPFYDIGMDFEKPKVEDAAVTRYTDSKLNAAKKIISEYWSV